MYTDDEDYREAIEADGRTVSIFMSLGVNIDNTAADDITAVTVDALPMSNPAQLTDANYELTKELATYEAYGIPTAPDAMMMAPPLTAEAYPPETGIWSSGLSDDDGDLSFTMTISLSRQHTSALTIYTEGPNILAGSVTFSNNGTTETVNLTAHNGYAVASGSHVYDTLIITITKISEGFRHLRITEIEFGDAITLSMSKLGGEVVYLDEIDPLQVGLPLCELDLQLINVLGDYDIDKPGTLFSQLEIGNPINLSFTVEANGFKKTIPLARLFIGQRNTSGDRLLVSAYDVRWTLSRSYKTWSISTSQDLGTALANLFQAHELGYIIDSSVSAIYPAASHTFDDSTTVLDDLQKLAQAYGLIIRPTRLGSIEVSTAWGSDEYGDIPVINMYTWPGSNQANRYNVIDIRYGTNGSYNRYVQDFSEPGEAKNILPINNELIVNETMAAQVYARIRAQIYGTAQEVEWRGDPAMDLSDMVGVFTRWTQEGTAETFRAIKREIRFDGALREITTVTK